jgi:hypothetical protein
MKCNRIRLQMQGVLRSGSLEPSHNRIMVHRQHLVPSGAFRFLARLASWREKAGAIGGSTHDGESGDSGFGQERRSFLATLACLCTLARRQAPWRVAGKAHGARRIAQEKEGRTTVRRVDSSTVRFVGSLPAVRSAPCALRLTAARCLLQSLELLSPLSY